MMTTADALHRLTWADDLAKRDLDELVTDRIVEGFQLEYERELTNGNKVLDAVCAMANTFGGVIVVGMDESDWPEHQGFGVPGPEGLVGVAPSERSRLASFCANGLVLPYDPEIVPVDLENGKVALVVRVDANAAPRPMTHNDKVLVRTEAGNRPADLYRLRILFSEGEGGAPFASLYGNPWPQNHPAFMGERPADLVIRSVGSASLGDGRRRPILTDAVRGHIREVLRQSSLSAWLSAAHPTDWSALGVNTWTPGGSNLSNRMELRWEGLFAGGIIYPECRFVAEWPRPLDGSSSPRSITLKFDLVLRLGAVPVNGVPGRLGLDDLFRFMLAIIEAFAGVLPDALSSVLPVSIGPLYGPAIGLATREGAHIDTVLTTSDLGLVADEHIGQGGSLYPTFDVAPREPSAQVEQARQWLEELLLDNCFVHGSGAAVADVVARCVPTSGQPPPANP